MTGVTERSFLTRVKNQNHLSPMYVVKEKKRGVAREMEILSGDRIFALKPLFLALFVRIASKLTLLSMVAIDVK